MLSHFIFTCPRCSSHELCRVERTLAYRRERHIVRKGDNYLPGNSELIDLEYQGLAGVQCAECRYPDNRKGSFKWKTWIDLEQSGCLTPDPCQGMEKVACTICSLDGSIYRTHVFLHLGKTLSKEQRQILLTQVLKEKPGIVTCERDIVQDVPDLERLFL